MMPPSITTLQQGHHIMKLLRYGKAGAEKPGMLDADGKLRDLSGVIADIDATTLSPASLRKLAKLDPASLPLVRGKPRLGPCVARPLNFVCIGLNYADHAAETGAAIPKEPIVFLKSLGAYTGPNDPVKMPRGSKKLDWEVELGIVIGTTARYVTEADAMKHVAGYCVINDVSEREYQSERGGTWDKGKGCDTFGPTGPWMVTKDEVKDPQNLAMWLDVNGKRMQNGSTKTMIFGVQQVVSYVSHFITLHAGDVIATGTPPGVGLGMKPKPVFLKVGQTMHLGIEGLGEQMQTVIAA
jgi:ureidoglycolate lyase